jgi:hypothetical protein
MLGGITDALLPQFAACQQEISANAGRRFYQRRGFVYSSHCSGKKRNDRFRYSPTLSEPEGCLTTYRIVFPQTSAISLFTRKSFYKNAIKAGQWIIRYWFSQ